MASHELQIRNLYKIFGARGRDHVDRVRNGMGKAELIAKHSHVLGLQDINITVPAEAITVIMGLSGSGKSTLIRHINRLIEPTSGEVMYDGVDICKMSQRDLREFRRHKTAMVFQKFALLPHRTVLDNILYGLQIQGIAKVEGEKRGRRWMERVGLQGFERHYPNQLSGGMQQRVGLARALTNNADILLMDEAYSALDPLIRVDMQTVLLDLQAELKKTVVFITHDLDEALRLGDKIAILRDGKVIQQGTGQEIVLHPADDYITAFVKDVNRGRIIRLETIAKPMSGEATGMVLPGGTTLEVAAKQLTLNGQTTAVVANAEGGLVGTVDLSDIVRQW